MLEAGRTPGTRCSAWTASRRLWFGFVPPAAPCRYRLWSRRASSTSPEVFCDPLHREGTQSPEAHGIARRDTAGCRCLWWRLHCCCTPCTPRAGYDHQAPPGHWCPLLGLCCPSQFQAHQACQKLQGVGAEAGEAGVLFLGRRDGVREASRLDMRDAEQSCCISPSRR